MNSDTVTLLLQIGGLLVFAFGWLWSRRKLIGWNEWPLLTATVDAYHVEYEEFNGQKMKKQFVDYTYEQNGNRYTGKFEALEPWDSHYTLITPVEVMYPKGMEIKVHVKPGDPFTSAAIRPEAQGMPKAL